VKPPRLVVAVALLGLVLFLVAPIAGLIARAPWEHLTSDLSGVRTAFVLSIVCSGSATALSFVFGVPLAWVIARGTFRGRRLLRALATLPLVLPPVVGGVALLFAFGRRGIIGAHLPFRLTFTTPGAILAETFVAMPFLVLTVEAALRSLDRGYEEVASTLGAGPARTFTRVTLPLIGPSLASGAALTWARAIGEFGATITFAGNISGRTQTLPLAVYLALETNPDAAIALSLVLLAVSIAVLVVIGPRTLFDARR
jgi:molybdate transport system permease protein